MTDNNSALHYPVIVENRFRLLTEHFLQRRQCVFKIIRRSGAQRTGPGGIMLQIREIYIDNSLQHFQGFNAFIAGGIPDQGQGRAVQLQRLQNPGKKRSTRNQGDGLHSHILQPLQAVGQLADGEGTPLIPVGDIPVLAIDTAEGTAGKENRAGAAGA